jgi:PAT family beta-lactamase induction signal transducer AmpG
MQQSMFTGPHNIFFLMLPAGISFGFNTVTLPYLLTQNGFSVAFTASIVAIGASASLFRFIWGPVIDLSLSLRKWFWVGALVCIASLLLLSITPLALNGATWLTLIVFISQVAANFLMVPVGGIMAHRIQDGKKGRAGGWYQAGNLGGMGLGGGLGLWLTTHYSVLIAGLVLCLVSAVSALVIMRIEDVHHGKDKGFKKEFVMIGKDIISMIRVPVVLFIIIMICMPIGSGAASYLWSAIADDWKTDADTVALVTGILSGLFGPVGCVAGGYIADRWGHWKAYLGAGTVCALVTVIMAMLPMMPYVYICGVLAYAFSLGLINASFSYVILYAVGKKNASTKYALLSSLGNIPVVYMTVFDGWTHDRFNSRYMLVAEAVVCILFVVICLVVLKQMRARNLLLQKID